MRYCTEDPRRHRLYQMTIEEVGCRNPGCEYRASAFVHQTACKTAEIEDMNREDAMMEARDMARKAREEEECPRICRNCTHFFPTFSQSRPNNGQCRKNPPVILPLSTQFDDHKTLFPLVDGKFTWCGEFSRKGGA